MLSKLLNIIIIMLLSISIYLILFYNPVSVRMQGDGDLILYALDKVVQNDSLYITGLLDSTKIVTVDMSYIYTDKHSFYDDNTNTYYYKTPFAVTASTKNNITVGMLQFSKSNDTLTIFYKIDHRSGGGGGDITLYKKNEEWKVLRQTFDK